MLERSLEFLGFPNYSVREDGTVIGPRGILKPYNAPYPKVTLMFEGVRKDISVHRIVALAFIPNPKNLPEVNHKDRNKLNPHRNNLEWTTPRANIQHAVRTGKFGRPKGSSKVRKQLQEALKQRELLGVNPKGYCAVWRIAKEQE